MYTFGNGATTLYHSSATRIDVAAVLATHECSCSLMRHSQSFCEFACEWFQIAARHQSATVVYETLRLNLTIADDDDRDNQTIAGLPLCPSTTGRRELALE